MDIEIEQAAIDAWAKFLDENPEMKNTTPFILELAMSAYLRGFREGYSMQAVF